LFTPNPKGSKLIFFTPFRAGVNEENQSFLMVMNMDNYKIETTMNKKIIIIAFITIIAIVVGNVNAQNNSKEMFVKAQMGNVISQYTLLVELLKDSVKPPRTLKNGNVKCVNTGDWTSGFFGGSLWYLYEYTKSPKWLDAATKWTNVLEKEKNNIWTHDLGFMLYCSFGNGLRLENTPGYKDILVQGAKSLCVRYESKVGCIQSWEPWGGMTFPVIIDNMMNLEYLFWTTRVTGDSSFYKIAISHADTTLKNHFRADYSTYHVVDYDSITGKIIKKRTAQGATDESAWARGQAWGLYGYTMMYRETKDKKYLNQAIRIADYIIGRLPADFIPYWDFDVPQDGTEPKDASAAAITSSALFELSQYVNDELAGKYYSIAEKTLFSLSTPNYLAKPGENGDFIIKHCVGHKPANSEIDVPLIYADYYYIEALMRYDKYIK
jgi:unsaturated chondroitin disaccharide hydrolase